MPPTPGGIFCFKGRPVSRILSGDGSCKRVMLPVRHLSCHIIANAVIRPTPRLGRAALVRRYTWSFNPSGVRLPVSPPGPVSSYLTFSPLTRRAGLFFSVTLLYPFGYLPVRKDGALCCPDFPPRHLSVRATDRPAGSKDNQLFRFRRSAIAPNGLHLSLDGNPHQSLLLFDCHRGSSIIAVPGKGCIMAGAGGIFSRYEGTQGLSQPAAP